MTTEVINNITHIFADEGKVFRRIGTEDIYGKEISLGYTYYINGEKLSQPHKDEPEDFEEIEDSNMRNNQE